MKVEMSIRNCIKGIVSTALENAFKEDNGELKSEVMIEIVSGLMDGWMVIAQATTIPTHEMEGMINKFAEVLCAHVKELREKEAEHDKRH